MEDHSPGRHWIGIAVILSIAIVGSAFLLSRSIERASNRVERVIASLESARPAQRVAAPTRERAPRRPDPDKVYRVAVGDAPVIGPKEARVTIVEFSDFQ